MAPGPPGELEPSEDGRSQADRELRTAVLVAIPVLLIGQVLLLAGWWPLAMALALGSTITGFALARRWSMMAGPPR